jgi:hypothetical protein
MLQVRTCAQVRFLDALSNVSSLLGNVAVTTEVELRKVAALVINTFGCFGIAVKRSATTFSLVTYVGMRMTVRLGIMAKKLALATSSGPLTSSGHDNAAIERPIPRLAQVMEFVFPLAAPASLPVGEMRGHVSGFGRGRGGIREA